MQLCNMGGRLTVTRSPQSDAEECASVTLPACPNPAKTGP